MKKLVLIDGNSVAFRAFYALPLLSNSAGFFTNAVYGFTMMLLKVIEDENPTHLFVAFDAGKKTFRHKEYAAYKEGRSKTPPEISEQFPLIKEVLDVFGIAYFELDQYEADDIIGTLASRYKGEVEKILVVSGDKDLFQLIDKNVDVLMMRKGVTDATIFDVQALKEKYTVSPGQVTDLKGLMGDNSDNIPGIPGVGEKTAIKLLSRFHSLEETLDRADEISGKLGEKVRLNKDQALISKRLATIHTQVPMHFTLEEFCYRAPDMEEVARVFSKLDFKALLKRLQEKDSSTSIQQDVQKVPYEVITEKNMGVAINKLKEDTVAVFVPSTEENPHRGTALGMALSGDSFSYYVSLDFLMKWEEGKSWFASNNHLKVLYNEKSTRILLDKRGATLGGVCFDVLLAAYLLNPSEGELKLANIVESYLDAYLPSDEDVFGKGAKRRVLQNEELIQHSLRTTVFLHQLYPILSQKLKGDNLLSLLLDVEMPLSQTLGNMEQLGISIDTVRLNELKEELHSSSESLKKEIYEIAGEEFNIHSPKQLGVVLFEKLSLDPIKKTKTGFSTDADVLEKLADQHEIARKIVHYRQVCKLLSTYVEGLEKEMHPDGKVHTQFKQTVAATGRLSSSDPNLQNIPIRLEEGRRIRQVFIPSHPGWKILAADYSQIELRVLAHLSGDSSLQQAFKEDRDIHTHTAMDVFGVLEGEVTKEMRRHAKAVNFGIVYGQSDFGLSQTLNIPRKEAKEFIQKYFQTYTGVERYMESTIEDARKEGYVTTLLHRRRYLPEINSTNYNRRSFAERTAMNTPIQGSAADIIKRAMIQLHQELRDFQSQMLLQVHDELVFEVPETELQEIKALVKETMESTLPLTVPLKVDISVGENWYEAK